MTVFGHRYELPFGVAPMGGLALVRYRGDIAMAEAAAQSRMQMIVSGAWLVALEEYRLQTRMSGFKPIFLEISERSRA